MATTKCNDHPDYDGNGEPPDPECETCKDLREEVEGASDEENEESE